MKDSQQRPHLGHLRKQARGLLCACFSGLIRLPEFAQGIRDGVVLLLAAA